MEDKYHKRIEDIVRKGEIACYKPFLLFSLSFPQLYNFIVSECGTGLTLYQMKLFKPLPHNPDF